MEVQFRLEQPALGEPVACVPSSGGTPKTCELTASYSGPTASRPCSARVLAATRSSFSPAVCPASYSAGSGCRSQCAR